MPHSETCMMMIGDGMPMIQSKVAIGLEIKMLSTICVEKPQKLFYNFNLMVCHFQEQNKVKSIKEPLVVNQLAMEKVRSYLIFRASIQNLCCCRSNRPCYVTYSFRSITRLQLYILHWILCSWFDYGRSRHMPRCHHYVYCRWYHPQNQST